MAVYNAITTSEYDFILAFKSNVYFEGRTISLLIVDDILLAYARNSLYNERNTALSIQDDVTLGESVIITFSGTVAEMLDAGPVGVIRTILFYKSDSTLLGTAYSDANGNFSIPLRCAPADKVRVICVGAAGQNSLIQERVIPYL